MHLCIVKRIRGSLGAFIHCIVENGPVSSNWAVVPTAKHQLWDLGAFPDQLRPRSSVNIHLPSTAKLEVAHPLGREPGGASPGFCWLDSPPWRPPTSPWPPHEHRSGLQDKRRDVQQVLTGFLRSCKLPRYQPRQGCDRRKRSYVQERGCGLQDTRIGEKKMIKHPNTLQIHSSCRLHRTSDDSSLSWILQ